MSIASATCLMFSSPIYTPFIARIFLKEPFKLVNMIAVVIGFIGVIFVTQPSFIFGYFLDSTEEDDSANRGEAQPGTTEYTIAALVCIFGAVCASFVYTIIRKTGGTVYFQVLVFYYGFLGS